MLKRLLWKWQSLDLNDRVILNFEVSHNISDCHSAVSEFIFEPTKPLGACQLWLLAMDQFNVSCHLCCGLQRSLEDCLDLDAVAKG